MLMMPSPLPPRAAALHDDVRRFERVTSTPSPLRRRRFRQIVFAIMAEAAADAEYHAFS
jgi:hypothetical protein